MQIKTKLVPKGFDAITCFPFILMRPEVAGDAALIAHEMVHYREQKASWVIPWLLRYLLSHEFRYQAELRGYRVQVELGGITREGAAQMLCQYGLGVTYDDALAALAA